MQDGPRGSDPTRSGRDDAQRGPRRFAPSTAAPPSRPGRGAPDHQDGRDRGLAAGRGSGAAAPRAVARADTGAISRPAAHSFRRTGRVLVALASVLVLAAAGTAWRTVDSLADGLSTTGALQLGGSSLTGESGAPSDGATDILLVGTDSRSDAQGNPLSAEELELVRTADVGTTNTDTIILIRVPNDGGSATAISIPRDSYVDVPGVGMNKINGAYGTAAFDEQVRLVEDEGVDPVVAEAQSTEVGRRTLVDTVQNLTGATIDHYAEIGLLGFVLLTDAVDGVDVCLNAAVDEPKSGADLPAGVQTLNGADALSFVRQRDELPRGDLDRITRQQVFMASLAGKVLSTGTLTDPSTVGALSSAIERSVVIDEGWDILGFATQLAGLAGGAVQFETIPVVEVGAYNERGQYIITVDPDEVARFAAAAIGGEPRPDDTAPSASADGATEVDPSEVTVAVANGSGATGLATGVSQRLVAAGYGQGEVGNAAVPAARSVVQAASADDPAAAAVAAELGGLEVTVDGTVPATVVRVVLGSDYAGPSGDGVVADSPPVLTDGGAGFRAQDDGGGDDGGGDDSGGSGEGAIDAGSGVPCVN